MAVTRKPTRKLVARPTRRATQPPRKSGGGSAPAVLAQPTNLTVEEV